MSATAGQINKKIIILGSTGSIGKNALDIIRHFPHFKAVALACQSNLSLLCSQAKEFNPLAATLTGSEPALAQELQQAQTTGRLPPAMKVYTGVAGLMSMIEETAADIVLNGIAGASGLLSSLQALATGKDLALANKETIVMAGPLIQQKARDLHRQIIPVDSEHSALFQLLQKVPPQNVKELVITASGGAFRDYTPEQLKQVRVEDALRHPTWQMGRKITIDSATMANKGLELIEAMFLFGFAPDQIRVLIHPQSYVHALIRTQDNTLYAQISQPDMRLPIQNALTYPELLSPPLEPFDLAEKSLTFTNWDSRKYHLLALAYEVAALRGPYPIVYNAANEIAVAAFLAGELAFLDIATVVQEALARDWTNNKIDSSDDILYIDGEVRFFTKNLLRRYV
jgi:1-deoxy-D-xylulose-5-phosphate reductoisomerase